MAGTQLFRNFSIWASSESASLRILAYIPGGSRPSMAKRTSPRPDIQKIVRILSLSTLFNLDCRNCHWNLSYAGLLEVLLQFFLAEPSNDNEATYKKWFLSIPSSQFLSMAWNCPPSHLEPMLSPIKAKQMTVERQMPHFCEEA